VEGALDLLDIAHGITPGAIWWRNRP
jgi:hypothetical protein